MASNPFDQLGRDAAKIDQFLKGAPRMMGQLAVREFVGSFRRQAFTDESGVTHTWPSRKVQRYKRKSGKGKSSRLVLTAAGKDDRKRALLVKSGRLRRSIRVTSRDKDSVTIGTDVVYAQAHNEGDTHLPQRQFMGASKALGDEVRNYLRQGVTTVMQSTQNVNIRPA